MIISLDSGIDLFLHPGEWEFADSSFRLRTTLGSCVAVVLWHPGERLGGMCHFMLPARRQYGEGGLSAKYGDEAIALLVEAVRHSGTRLRDYRAKLFGGGAMFPTAIAPASRVATDNIATAREQLAALDLPVVAASVGGSGHRTLVFDIASGDVWVRHVAAAPSAPAKEEIA